VAATTKARSRAEPVPHTRHYESPLRRQQAAETRQRIIAAGCDLLHGSSVRDWQPLTIRGVAHQAGVNERTVYRYFTNERGLRDAVMHQLEQDAGIDLAGMTLEDISEVTVRTLSHISSYPREAKPALDPTLSEAHSRQREALIHALAGHTRGWSASEKGRAAAMFDVLWSVASFERLVSDWQMDNGDAIATVTWAIELIAEGVRNGVRPTS
jgi:AcrR family transcriptional regulator